MEEKGRKEKSDVDGLWTRSEWCDVRRIQLGIMGFEDGGRETQRNLMT